MSTEIEKEDAANKEAAGHLKTAVATLAKSSPLSASLMAIILAGVGAQLKMTDALDTKTTALQVSTDYVSERVDGLNASLEKLTDETRADLRELRIQAAERAGAVKLNSEQISGLRDRLNALESK